MVLAIRVGSVTAALGAAVACSSSDDATSPAPDATPDGGTTPGTDGGTTPGTDGGSTPAGDGGTTADAEAGANASVVELGAGEAFTCARFGDGTVKCWGKAEFGQLGRGNKDTLRGNLALQPPLDFGTGARAIALATGSAHACVILEGGSVKCWGANDEGQLGRGDTDSRGDDANEMGLALVALDLGAGAKATAISAGDDHTCALLDDGRVKCWGGNGRGQLGIGDRDSRGDGPNEMGPNLLAVDLGQGKKAVEISAGFYATCARLDDGTVKCWGWNASGQLGQSDTEDRGAMPNQMGASLPPVNLGAGRTAAQVWMGGGTACARLDDGSLKCWGAPPGLYGNPLVQIGDEPGEMAALSALDFGGGRKVVDLGKGVAGHACVRLDDKSLACWGSNTNGQLGLGDTTSRTFTTSSITVPAVDLGTGRNAAAISLSADHACAKLDDGRVKCWGRNMDGQLGLGDANARGDGPGEMGDALPAVGF